MVLEMLQEKGKYVSTPEDLFWAVFVTGLIFIFLVALYPAILILGQLEKKERSN